MTYNQFLFKAVLNNFRKYLAYFFCIAFSMTVFFLFTAIWFAPEFSEQTSSGTRQIVQIAGVISCVFSVFIITYSNQQFFKSRTKEFAILLSYGLLYRDMKRIIIIENSLIFLMSLLVAWISGSVFSRLIFMITTSILAIEDITFSLTMNSFLWTTIAFIPIYVLMVGVMLVKMKTNDVTKLLKENRVKEMKRGGNPFLALLGLMIIIASITYLSVYTSDFSNIDTMREVILLSLACCIAGVYLLLTHVISLLYMFFNRSETLFHKNILTLSEFASKFAQNRSIIFIVCLLSMGAVFFSTLSYTLYHQSYAIADDEQLFDVVMKDYDVINLWDQMNVGDVLAQEEGQLSNQGKLNIVYLQAPEMDHTPWRTEKQVIVTTANELNDLIGTEYIVDTGNARLIDFNQSQHDTITYFEETIHLENEQHQYTFGNSGIEQVKLFDRYLFSQPVLILLNDDDMKKIVADASREEIGSVRMFKFENWLNSGTFVSELRDEMESVILENPEAMEMMAARYNRPLIVHSKYERYHHIKQVWGFALFIMSFLSILFVVTSCLVLYFKTFADKEGDQQKLRLLQTVGITSTEIKSYLNSKLKMIVVLPIVFGSMLGLCLSMAMNLYNVVEIEIHNSAIFVNGLKVVCLYFIIIVIYYYWLRMTYRKAVE